MAKEKYEYPYSDERGNYTFRTIGGRKVKIYENQSLADAMIESGKFKGQKNKKDYRESYREAKEEEKEDEKSKLHQQIAKLGRESLNASQDRLNDIFDETDKLWDKIRQKNLEGVTGPYDKKANTEQDRKSKAYDKEYGKAYPYREQYKQEGTTDLENIKEWEQYKDANQKALEREIVPEFARKNKGAIEEAEREIEKSRNNLNKKADEVLGNKSTKDPYDDPESEESQRLQDIQSRYDDYLQKTEGRGASYGELAHIQGLRGKELDDFEKELDFYNEFEDKQRGTEPLREKYRNDKDATAQLRKEIAGYLDDRDNSEQEFGDRDEFYNYMNKNWYNVDKDKFDKIFDEEESKRNESKNEKPSQELIDALRTAYIYKDEGELASGLGKAKEHYGEKAVNDAFKYYDDNYVVVKGTNVDTEGLGYNSLLEKKDYPKEALDQYLKDMENLRNSGLHYRDTHAYNEKSRELLDNLKQATIKDAIKKDIAEKQNKSANEKFGYNDARDILNQLNSEGSDFTFGEIEVDKYNQNYKDTGKLKTEVSVFMPDERGYTTRELEIPINKNETRESFEEKLRDWQSRHNSPDTWEDKDFKSTNETMNNAIREKASKKTQGQSYIDTKRKAQERQYSADEEDILDRYGEDYGYPKGDNLKNLKGQIDYMRIPNESIHKTAERLVEGGDFLIYNDDIKNWLKERNIKFNDDNFFDKYKKVMADDVERLYNKANNQSFSDSIRNKANIKNQWKQYLKDHPNSKMSLSDFKKMNK